jgi:hypothetical protein
VTLTNEKILTNGIEQAKHDLKVQTKDLVVLMELTMSTLRTGTGTSTDAGSDQANEVDKKDFLDRVDTLCALGHHVLISNFPLFAQVHIEIRRFTDAFILMVIGASTLQGLFDPQYYTKYAGGIMAAFGHMFDQKTRLYVYPYKSEKECMTAHTFNPPQGLSHLYQHLTTNHLIVDMQNCDDVDTSLHSEVVRKLLSAGNPKWEALVPPAARELIKKRKLFGYSS